MPGKDSPRNLAVRLLTEYFKPSPSGERKAVFSAALGGCDPDPCVHIEFEGALAAFAANAVDQLLPLGSAGRGQHHLALLITHMANARGKQTDPDYLDLPRVLNQGCALPSRAEELKHLAVLLVDVRNKARIFSSLQGFVRKLPESRKKLTQLWDGDMDLAQIRLRRVSKAPTARVDAPERPYSDILSAFDDVPRGVLLGAPGAGKSTTLRKLAYDLAHKAELDAHEPIPILVALGLWTKQDQPLVDFLDAMAPEVGWAVEALRPERRVVLLLDGLNEVPTAFREAKAAEVRRLCEDFHAAGAKVIASCRLEDYQGDLDLGIDTLTLEPLKPQRIREVVHHWVAECGEGPETAEKFFWQLAGDEGLLKVFKTCSDKRIAEETFWDPNAEIDSWKIEDWSDLRGKHLRSPRCLMRLASNPFLLTMLYQVWVKGDGALPPNRGELFELFVKQLTAREESRDPAWRGGGALQEGLARLAWQMQRKRVDSGEGSDYGVLTAAPSTQAAETLGGSGQLRKALDATFLEGEGEVRFRHQLLQEYFTAKALVEQMPSMRASELWPEDRWWERSGWEETLKLLAGLYGEDCTPVVRWLVHAQPEVAMECLEESGADVVERTPLLAELQAAWMPRLADTQREPHPLARAAVGRAIGRLGLDTRKGIGCRGGVPEIDWVEIPAGTFVYQEEKKRRKTERFWMARYPVTSAQFDAFLRAEDGYVDARRRKGLSKPEHPATREWAESNHPRVDVDWHEAMAFCAWLESKLKRGIRLPTELEWERAARGPNGRVYPWGDEFVSGYANIDETASDEKVGAHYVGRTTAVGIYPNGVSEEGMLDLSGNVWEWFADEVEKETRALRGGSWYFYASSTNAAFFLRLPPFIRNNNYGFRVVCSAPIL